MKQNYSEEELQENWKLSSQELLLINSKQDIYKLIFALKLKFFRRFGYTLENHEEIPAEIIEYVATQVGNNIIPPNYSSGGRICREHIYSNT